MNMYRPNRNIFEIWMDRGCRVPFKVRDINKWQRWRSLEIVRVDRVRSTRDGLRGRAFTRDLWYHNWQGDIEKQVLNANYCDWEEVVL